MAMRSADVERIAVAKWPTGGVAHARSPRPSMKPCNALGSFGLARPTSREIQGALRRASPSSRLCVPRSEGGSGSDRGSRTVERTAGAEWSTGGIPQVRSPRPSMKPCDALSGPEPHFYCGPCTSIPTPLLPVLICGRVPRAPVIRSPALYAKRLRPGGAAWPQRQEP